MSKINFNGCESIGDLYRRHNNRLVGKVLLQFAGVSHPSTLTTVRSPIYSVKADGDFVSFTTEDGKGKEILLPFRKLLPVVTSIFEVGDVHWSPDNYQSTQYSIDDLDDDDLRFDPHVKESESLPSEVMVPDLVPVGFPVKRREPLS